jgi:hypothetical protein
MTTGAVYARSAMPVTLDRLLLLNCAAYVSSAVTMEPSLTEEVRLLTRLLNRVVVFVPVTTGVVTVNNTTTLLFVVRVVTCSALSFLLPRVTPYTVTLSRLTPTAVAIEASSALLLPLSSCTEPSVSTAPWKLLSVN